MRIIVLENNAYKVTEKQYAELSEKRDEIFSKGWYPAQDVDMSEFIESKKPQYKDLGPIEFDFRL